MFSPSKSKLNTSPNVHISPWAIESYASAVELLKNTYGRPDLIKAARVTKFLELTPPAHKISELKEFYASFECPLRSMNSMNVTQDDIWSVTIFYKIPSPLRGILRR